MIFGHGESIARATHQEHLACLTYPSFLSMAFTEVSQQKGSFDDFELLSKVGPEIGEPACLCVSR